MSGTVRWIITAISLLHCALTLASPFDFKVRVQNANSAFLGPAQLCGLAPLALNGVAYDWEITSTMPIRRTGRQYCVELGGVGPFQSRQVSVHWRPLVERRGEKSPKTGHYDLLPRPSPELMQLADSFARYPKTDRVRRIYEWMLGNVAFSGIRRGVDGAEHALRVREGDCTEHMLLAAELLERNGFTVRRVLGGALPQNQFRITANNIHNWVEYLEGGQWLIFDSSRGVLGKPDRQHYIALHFYEDSQQLRMAPLSAGQPHLKLYLQ